MAGVNPSKRRILLVGPRVIHLKPFFERRRYAVVAVQKGVEGMSALDAEPRDIVILELNLGDLTATEFLMAARQAHADASFLLLDDASKAGQIVKALQAGLDGYLPTPPDEDRLFFEVERHLRRSAPDGDATGGFQTTTQLTERPDELKAVTELQTQLADRESQLVELGMQTDLLNQEIVKLREEAKKLNAVRGALIGQIEGDLDEDQAFRIKERLAMASVLETEADTLREELGGARNVRRELQQEIELLKKRVQDLSDVPEVSDDDGSAERIEEPESDNMVSAGRIAELEEELDLTKAEILALEQKHKDELSPLQREINRLSSDEAIRASDDDKLAMEHMAAVARIENEHKSQLARMREEHGNLVGRLKEEQEASLKTAVSDVEIERASLKDKIESAVKDALRGKEREHLEMLGGKEKEIQQKLTAALDANGKIATERDQAVFEKEEAIAKALDIELVLDELKTKIEFLEGEVTKAQDRAGKAESDFKKDKQRLIQEKEEVAAGSQAVFERVQRFVDENGTLKKANVELEANRAALEERAKRGEELAQRAEAELAQTGVIRAEAIQQRDTAEGAKRAIEDRFQTMERQLTERIAQLEAGVEEERMRRDNAERALADSGEAVTRLADTSNRLADARAAIAAGEAEQQRLQGRIDDAERNMIAVRAELATTVELAKQRQDSAVAIARGELEREIQRLREELEDSHGERERTLVQARADLDRALTSQGGSDQIADELRARITQLEDGMLEREARAREARESAEQAVNDAVRQRNELQQQYEARLRDATGGGGGGGGGGPGVAEIAQERDAYRARLAETEAWVQQAQLHLEALRVERDQLIQQATALSNDQQSRGSEAQELYSQLSMSKQQVEALTGKSAGLEQELAMARQQVQHAQQRAQQAASANAASTTDAQTLAIMQDEVKNLRAQLQATQQQVQRGGGPVARLPEELEPLRWTLTAAIDALTSLEQREPALASHLRNLRLLATTLQKLSG